MIESTRKSRMRAEKNVESSNQSEPVGLQSLYVFPLKSAGALSRDKMRFHENGTPLLDRIYYVEHLGRFRASTCRNWRKLSREWIRRIQGELACFIVLYCSYGTQTRRFPTFFF